MIPVQDGALVAGMDSGCKPQDYNGETVSRMGETVSRPGSENLEGFELVKCSRGSK
jgi:hypothetical protein